MLTRDPLYAVQGHVIYQTRSGVWAAMDTTYYTGGQTTIDDKRGEPLENLRFGATIAIPMGWGPLNPSRPVARAPISQTPSQREGALGALGSR
jgi:hypothetical protein